MLEENCDCMKINIACGYTDPRNGIDCLDSLIENYYSFNPFDEIIGSPKTLGD